MTARLLLVEDEEHLAFALRFNLEAEGYEVTTAATLAEARGTLETGEPHNLIVLDVMLPDGSGRSFCEQLRRSGDRTPVLMLTAKNTPPDIIAGLEAGADDYLGKPFDLSELLGRITALLRRRQWDRGTPSVSDATTVAFGAATLDRATRRIRTGDNETELTELELRLAEYFVQRPNEIVRREALLEDVWGVSPNSQTRTVDNFVARLRKLIEPEPRRPRYLTTVRGAGYRYTPGG